MFDPTTALATFAATSVAGGLAFGLVPQLLDTHLRIMWEEEQRRAADKIIGPSEEEARWIYWTNPEAQA